MNNMRKYDYVLKKMDSFLRVNDNLMAFDILSKPFSCVNTPGGCFTNVSQPPQDILSKFV